MGEPLYVGRAEVVTSSDQQDRDKAEFVAKTFLVRYRVQSTRNSYKLALDQWFQWCDQHFTTPLTAQRWHVELFARELEDTGRKLSTVSIKLNALAGFYKFAVADGFIERNPMDHVIRPQIERESTTIGLTRPEAADLLTVARGSTPLDHFMIFVLLLNGLRVGELCGIDIEHLSYHRGARTAQILRKGGKRQIIPFAHSTAHGLERVLVDHPTSRGALLRTREGGRMDGKAVGRVVKRLYLDARISKRAHPHALRHTFVTLSRDAGESDRDIIASTGHADGRMIEYYDRARDKIERNVTHGLAAYVERAT